MTCCWRQPIYHIMLLNLAICTNLQFAFCRIKECLLIKVLTFFLSFIERVIYVLVMLVMLLFSHCLNFKLSMWWLMRCLTRFSVGQGILWFSWRPHRTWVSGLWFKFSFMLTFVYHFCCFSFRKWWWQSDIGVWCW